MTLFFTGHPGLATQGSGQNATSFTLGGSRAGVETLPLVSNSGPLFTHNPSGLERGQKSVSLLAAGWEET